MWRRPLGKDGIALQNSSTCAHLCTVQVVSNNFPSCRDSHPFFWAVWLMEGEGAGGGSGHAPPHTMDGGEDVAAQVGVIIQYKLEGGDAGLALG